MQRNTRLFIVLLILYAVHLSIKYNSIVVPVWISSYVADLLCVPFILSLFVMIVRFVKKQNTFRLPPSMIVFAVLYISFVFEYLMPKYSARYTADPVDVVFYFIGGVFYFFFQNREMKSIEQKRQ